MLNTEPMAPTQANIKFAHRLASEIREKIKYGTFSVNRARLPETGASTAQRSCQGSKTAARAHRRDKASAERRGGTLQIRSTGIG